MKIKKLFKYLVIAVLLSFFFVETAQALRITLKRVVFEGAKRAEVITIINNTDKPETYRLGWRHFRMTANESLVPIPEDQPMPADIKPSANMIRFAPRRFTVPPNSSQQVRMMLRMPKDLADGEYRSHFWVRPEVDPDELKLKAGEKAKATGARGGVTLTMLAGVTMPIIVRKGALNASLSIGNLSAYETGGFVTTSFSLLREGSKSIYGDIDFVCNAGGDEYIIKSSRGIAIYTELSRRDFNLRIPKTQGQPRCNSLSLRFTEIIGFGGKKGATLAEASVAVNQ